MLNVTHAQLRSAVEYGVSIVTLMRIDDFHRATTMSGRELQSLFDSALMLEEYNKKYLDGSGVLPSLTLSFYRDSLVCTGSYGGDIAAALSLAGAVVVPMGIRGLDPSISFESLPECIYCPAGGHDLPKSCIQPILEGAENIPNGGDGLMQAQKKSNPSFFVRKAVRETLMSGVPRTEYLKYWVNPVENTFYELPGYHFTQVPKGYKHQDKAREDGWYQVNIGIKGKRIIEIAVHGRDLREARDVVKILSERPGAMPENRSSSFSYSGSNVRDFMFRKFS
jgi:hypothetical protein